MHRLDFWRWRTNVALHIDRWNDVSHRWITKKLYSIMSRLCSIALNARLLDLCLFNTRNLFCPGHYTLNDVVMDFKCKKMFRNLDF